jgi:hypothetical protein
MGWRKNAKIERGDVGFERIEMDAEKIMERLEVEEEGWKD